MRAFSDRGLRIYIPDPWFPKRVSLITRLVNRIHLWKEKREYRRQNTKQA